MLQLEHISRAYGKGDARVLALNDVSLEIERGEFVCITGESGSGKSTLLNLLGVTDKQTSGTYVIGGEEVGGLMDKKSRKLRSNFFGYVLQSFGLIDELSVMDNILLPARYGGVHKDEAGKRADALMAQFGIEHKKRCFPSELSGGQRQRVAIARALMNRPDVILADEPTGALDSLHTHDVMEILSRLNRDGQTIVMVTHNDALTAYASRLLTLHDGRFVA